MCPGNQKVWGGWVLDVRDPVSCFCLIVFTMFLDSHDAGVRTLSSEATGMALKSCINFCSTGSNSYATPGSNTQTSAAG